MGEFLDENIKIIQKDEKTPQLSEPWVTFCKSELFPAVSNGRSIKSRPHAPEAHEEEDEDDGDDAVAPQDLVDDVLAKGLEWFRGRVIGSEKIRSTPQGSIYRYFNFNYLLKVADRIYPPAKRGVGQRGRGKHISRRGISDEPFMRQQRQFNDVIRANLGIENSLIQEDSANGNLAATQEDTQGSYFSVHGGHGVGGDDVVEEESQKMRVAGEKRKAGRKKGDDMSTTSRDPKEVDKSLN